MSQSKSKNSRRQKKRESLPWVTNIEKKTLNNQNWRHVLHTSESLQVVVMSVPQKQELGWEMHDESDQFFRVEKGSALVEIDTGKRVKSVRLTEDMVIVIPRYTWHNVINTSKSQPLQMYSIYGPPHHPDKTLDRTHEAEIRRTQKRRK